MDFTPYFDVLGEPGTLALGALAVGLLFGVAAQRSGFCLRSAVVDMTGTGTGAVRWQRLCLWLVVFGAAIAATQIALSARLLDVENVRQLTSARSISGVLIGGLLFGIGMTLTRGCVSRLTVLSANGNFRAVFSLLLFAIVAYATFDGVLTPLRRGLLGLWTFAPGANLNLLSAVGYGPMAGVAAGALVIAAGLLLGRVGRLSAGGAAWGLLLGASVAAGWWLTYTLSRQVFEPIPVESISFIRPTIDVIVLGGVGFPLSGLTFGIGLLGGVLAGSFAAAAFTRSLKFEWFDSARGAGRYAAGAALMGFGGVLAGGCSVGAGLTGGSLFAIGPLLAVAAMAAGSALTQLTMLHLAAGSVFGRPKVVPAE